MSASFATTGTGWPVRGITPNTGASLPGRECSEAPDLDPVAVGERIGNCIENGVDGGFGIAVIEAGIGPCDAFHEFRLDHLNPASRNHRPPTAVPVDHGYPVAQFPR
jgi:hypothetical protein